MTRAAPGTGGSQPRSGSRSSRAGGTVHQLLGALHPGDAVGNEALAIRSQLRGSGYTSEIFSGWVDPRLASQARPLSDYPYECGPDTVCLLHFSAGSPANRLAHAAAHRLVCIYHNVTPAHLFLGYSPELVRLCHHGRRELAQLASRAELGLGVSEFNRQELEELGFAETGVLPFVFDFAAYQRRPSRVVRRLYDDTRTNLLFVGRVVPNKRIEDLLRVFAVYQRRLRGHSRLLVVGEDGAAAAYRHRLEQMVGELGVEAVVFTGHVDDDELLAYYSLAQVFVCLSEHEGFGVPLVEAMHLGVPVVAYDAGAVADTLQGGGVLFRERDPVALAEVVEQIVARPEFRQAVLATQARAMAERRAIGYGQAIEEQLWPVLDQAKLNGGG